MIIQPLVENAVKHGICNMPEGGTIRITARRAGSMLHIGVHNPVDEDMASIRSEGHGIGLTNVRQRLSGAYKHEAGIQWGRQRTALAWTLRCPRKRANKGIEVCVSSSWTMKCWRAAWCANTCPSMRTWRSWPNAPTASRR
jgi:LytS/YehU family sensor histidine kinase